MKMKHNRWLDWKIRHGLATRGRTGGKMNPKGLLGGIVYKLFFKRYDTGPKTDERAVFTQHVGGTLGARGETNGE